MNWPLNLKNTWIATGAIFLFQTVAFVLRWYGGVDADIYFALFLVTSGAVSIYERKKRMLTLAFGLSTIQILYFLGPMDLVLAIFVLVPRFMVEQIIKGRRSEEDHLAQSIWVNSTDHLFIKDMDGRYTNVNKAVLDFFGLAEDDMIGRNDAEIFDEERARLYRSSDLELIGNGKPTVITYDEIIGGKTYRMQTIKQLLKDEEGNTIGILGIGRDMTQYYALYEEERRINSLLNSLLDSAIDPIFVKNRESVYTLVNRAFANFHGMRPEDIRGKDDFFLYSDKTARKFRERDRLIFKTGKSLTYENKTVIEGKVIYSLTSKGPIYDDDGNITGLVGIAHDITDLRNYQKQLIEAQKMESIGILSGGIAHDLNNTLTSITGYLSLLEAVTDDPMVHEAIENIRISTDRAVSLIKKLQLFTRREREEVEGIEINALLSDIIQIVKSGALGRITFVTHFGEEEIMIDGEPTAVQQVFMNILVNAVESIEDRGTIDIETSLEEVHDLSSFYIVGKAAEPGKFARVTIRDTGVGIDPKIMDRLFEPFVTSKRKGTKKGTGLGLSIVYGVMQSHKGLIDISTSPEGTEFSVYFPLGVLDSPKMIEVMRLKRGEGIVMVIEDEPEIRKFLENALTSLGYTSIMAASGKEGLEYASSIIGEDDHRSDGRMVIEIVDAEKDLDLTPKFIILDYILPDIKGDEVFRRLKQMGCTSKVIISSGYMDSGVLNELREEGVWAFLPKPFTIYDLSNVLSGDSHSS